MMSNKRKKITRLRSSQTGTSTSCPKEKFEIENGWFERETAKLKKCLKHYNEKVKLYEERIHREHLENYQIKNKKSTDEKTTTTQKVFDCVVCHEINNEKGIRKTIVFPSCSENHVMCMNCYERIIKLNNACPICRTRLRADKPIPIYRPDPDDYDDDDYDYDNESDENSYHFSQEEEQYINPYDDEYDHFVNNSEEEEEEEEEEEWRTSSSSSSRVRRPHVRESLRRSVRQRFDRARRHTTTATTIVQPTRTNNRHLRNWIYINGVMTLRSDININP